MVYSVEHVTRQGDMATAQSPTHPPTLIAQAVQSQYSHRTVTTTFHSVEHVTRHVGWAAAWPQHSHPPTHTQSPYRHHSHSIATAPSQAHSTQWSTSHAAWGGRRHRDGHYNHGTAVLIYTQCLSYVPTVQYARSKNVDR